MCRWPVSLCGAWLVMCLDGGAASANAATSSARFDVTGTQPAGILSGKIVYIHGGHGYTADNLVDGAWTTQRGELYELVEDLGNQDAMTILAEALWRAGATVVPLRPVGHQPNEIVLDNDDPEVSFVGSWSAGSGPYFGDAADVPYLYANSAATETAYARYRPTITADGFYPVYCWTSSGANRVRQMYRITHSGGSTEVVVDHRRVGSGPVYLGTFHFEAGTSGYVDISNQSDDVGAVIADMIRFGNGMGDIDRGGGVSGQTRADESGLYWIKWHVDRCVGVPESSYRISAEDRVASVSFSPRYAAYMNREATGAITDRVFVSFHSNASGGTARGVIALYNGTPDPGTATPNQQAYAELMAAEVNDDMVALNGTFEHDWEDRISLTYDPLDFDYGEINNTYINDEFDATIIETGVPRQSAGCRTAARCARAAGARPFDGAGAREVLRDVRRRIHAAEIPPQCGQQRVSHLPRRRVDHLALDAAGCERSGRRCADGLPHLRLVQRVRL
jgi:hypothetical protein